MNIKKEAYQHGETSLHILVGYCVIFINDGGRAASTILLISKMLSFYSVNRVI